MMIAESFRAVVGASDLLDDFVLGLRVQTPYTVYISLRWIMSLFEGHSLRLALIELLQGFCQADESTRILYRSTYTRSLASTGVV